MLNFNVKVIKEFVENRYFEQSGKQFLREVDLDVSKDILSSKRNCRLFGVKGYEYLL